MTNGQPVSFSVRAHNSAGWGPWSGPSPVVTPDIEPGRPAAPSVQFADGALLVSWSPPANEGSAITAYDVQIGGGASAIQRVGNTTTFRWDGLTNGQEYTFMVRAVNAKGEGQFSSLVGARAPAAPARRARRRRSASVATSSSTCAGPRPPTVATRSSTTRCGCSPPAPCATATGTTLRWSNLPNGQAQQFQVRARNRGGWGALSAASAPVIPCGVPDAPGSVSAVRGDTAATVSWAAPYDQGCAISGYTVTASSGASVNVGGGQTSMTFGGLSNGTTYTFTVVARNEVGTGARSAASNAVVPAGPPGAPQCVSAPRRTRGR